MGAWVNGSGYCAAWKPIQAGLELDVGEAALLPIGRQWPPESQQVGCYGETYSLLAKAQCELINLLSHST